MTWSQRQKLGDSIIPAHAQPKLVLRSTRQLHTLLCATLNLELTQRIDSHHTGVGFVVVP